MILDIRNCFFGSMKIDFYGKRVIMFLYIIVNGDGDAFKEYGFT